MSESTLPLFTEHDRRDVPGFEGRYAATFDGRIWSYPKQGGRNHNGQWLTPQTHASGYQYVRVGREFGTGNYMVHRLVALAWIPNPNRLPEVNHKDSNRANNRADNLEWISKSDNIRHMHAAQRAKRDPREGPSDYVQHLINLRRDRRSYDEYTTAFDAYCAQLPPSNTATQSRKLWHFSDYRRNITDRYAIRAQMRASVEELKTRR